MILQQFLLKNKRIGLLAIFLLVLFMPTPAEAASLPLKLEPNDSGQERYHIIRAQSINTNRSREAISAGMYLDLM